MMALFPARTTRKGDEQTAWRFVVFEGSCNQNDGGRRPNTRVYMRELRRRQGDERDGAVAKEENERGV